MAIGVENIVISAITKMELLLGTENKQELTAMKKKIQSYPVIPITEAVSVQAIEYIENYRLSQNLQIPDAIIGATATNFDLPLLTYNLKDFRFLPDINLLQ
jgi:predicted nucleic acid-binding protein